MARTAEAAALTRRHGALQHALRAATLRDLLGLYSVVDPTNLTETIGPFSRAGALLALAHRRDSVALAGRYFRGFRLLEEITGAAEPILAKTPELAEAETVVRSSTLAGIINGRRRGQSVLRAKRNGFVKLGGAVAGFVVGGARGVLLESVTADREALGWQRVTESSHPCAFCRMLASRGAVYKSEGTSEFHAHDHCSCLAEPYYEGSSLLPENARFRRQWNRHTKGLSGDRALEVFRDAVDDELHDRAHESLVESIYGDDENAQDENAPGEPAE